ncbi:hypothetical protein ACFHYQ_13595 [Sphaerimonospora cavernae]|uniref:Threonine dehydrogenase-like Zn-dependent dehydrogenase n=1 Tax=Sphaerimonospora cavernae TaxID=1740611 RepID=A0ABV6U4E5_9ACTN
MTAMDTRVPRHYAGARVALAYGQARVLPPLSGGVPTGWAAGRWSVLSPGTERRHLTGPPREAGYMTLGRRSDQERWALAPVPHGAVFDPVCPGAVVVPAGVSIQVAAVARFQQIAVLGLSRIPAGVDIDNAVVVGSGPIALGCVLELHRRGATAVRVVTARRLTSIATMTYVRRVSAADLGTAPLVIDAAGAPRRAAGLLSPGGILGLLGTPIAEESISALAAHRGGWTVLGMHELAPAAPGGYQSAYTAAVTWLAGHIDRALVESWCRIVPGRRAPEIYRLLDSPERPAEPVVLFDWETS